jgi:hypothetical protein
MTLKDLEKEYDKLQKKYGAKELDSIHKDVLIIRIYALYL